MSESVLPPTAAPSGSITAATAYTAIQRRLVLTFAIAGALIESMELNLLSFPLTDLSASFGVDTTAIVGTITLQSLASIAGGFLFGYIADRFGRRPTYVSFVAIYGVLAVVGGLVGVYGLFVLTRVIAGLAMGGAFGVIFAMFSESWRSRKRGLMGAVLQGMFIAGTLITQLILFLTLSGLGSDAGWRSGFVIIGVLCLLLGIAAQIWLPESKLWQAAREVRRRGRPLEAEQVTARPEEKISGRRVAIGAVFLTLCTTGVFASSYSYITFAPTFLRETVQAPLGVSTLVLTLGTVLGIASYIVFGSLSDRIGRRRAVVASCIVAVLGFGAFALFGAGTEGVAIAALMGTAIGYGGFGVLGTWISEYYPTRFRAFGSGATYYVARGLGSGLYPLFALTLAGGDLRIALAFGAFGAVIGLIGALFVPDTAGRLITANE